MWRFSAIVGLSLVVVVGIAAGAAGPLMSRIETPVYEVERTDGAIELRAYAPMMVASVVVTGERSAAVNQGFRRLAGYIFGDNADATKIAMTAPVMQSRDADAAAGPERAWTIRFVMPRGSAREKLPKPRDAQVKIEAIPAATFAVIRFSGFWRDRLLAQKTDELKAYLARNKLAARGAPIYAFYDPPWTLPMFRRNEVMIEVGPA